MFKQKYLSTDARRFVFNLFEHPNATPLNRWVNYSIMLLISLNIVAIVFESVDAIHRQYEGLFYAFEVCSVLLFTIEYILRVWASVDQDEADNSKSLTQVRLRYMLTPMALIDLLSIVPFYLTLFFAIDLRFMRFLRLLRIFKLTRYSSSLEILLSVMREESRAFSSTLLILLVVLLISASGIYFFEKDAQPDSFGSIPLALWWAIATLTTVGYGDVIPITLGGRIFGTMVMIVGIGMVALPTGILSSAFSEELRSRRQRYKVKLKEALEDGIITEEEEATLELLRQELDISEEDAKHMLHHSRSIHYKKGHLEKCPHCGKHL